MQISNLSKYEEIVKGGNANGGVNHTEGHDPGGPEWTKVFSWLIDSELDPEA